MAATLGEIVRGSEHVAFREAQDVNCGGNDGEGLRIGNLLS